MGTGQAGQETAGTGAMVRVDTITLNKVVGIYSAAMEDTPGALTDKLCWRRARGEWHCFEKVTVRGFMSLCQRRETTFVRGQQIARPEADMRCGVCDGLEMARRGWSGSGPASSRRAGKSLSK
jgi:hypothetical protein